MNLSRAFARGFRIPLAELFRRGFSLHGTKLDESIPPSSLSISRAKPTKNERRRRDLERAARGKKLPRLGRNRDRKSGARSEKRNAREKYSHDRSDFAITGYLFTLCTCRALEI